MVDPSDAAADYPLHEERACRVVAAIDATSSASSAPSESSKAMVDPSEAASSPPSESSEAAADDASFPPQEASGAAASAIYSSYRALVVSFSWCNICVECELINLDLLVFRPLLPQAGASGAWWLCDCVLLVITLGAKSCSFLQVYIH